MSSSFSRAAKRASSSDSVVACADILGFVLVGSYQWCEWVYTVPVYFLHSIGFVQSEKLKSVGWLL